MLLLFHKINLYIVMLVAMVLSIVGLICKEVVAYSVVWNELIKKYLA